MDICEKYNENNKINKYKVRLIVQSFLQRPDIDMKVCILQ